jgi:transposase
MKPVKYKPYAKTSYLPVQCKVDRSTSVEELLHFLSLHQKEIGRLQLALEHKEKEVAAYQAEVERLEGVVSGQIQARFGRSTEKRVPPVPPDDADSPAELPPPLTPKWIKTHKQRGAKPGHPGHGRHLPDLPEREMVHELTCDQQCCPLCGARLNETGLTEASYQIDVDIQYVLVKHVRKRGTRSCTCQIPTFMTAPKPPQVIPKGMFTHGFLAHVLASKYVFQIPLYRQILQMEMQGLFINEGSLVGSFRKLHTWLTPLYERLINESRTRSHWHVDETGWHNFVLSEENQHFNWWLWVFASSDVVLYVLDPSRSTDVPRQHLGEAACGIVSSDRYSAYAKLGREVEGLVNAFCWVHVRRDFINAGKAFVFLIPWAQTWVDRIAQLYRLNHERLFAAEDSLAKVAAHEALKKALDHFQDQLHAELEETDLHPRKRKILRSALRN